MAAGPYDQMSPEAVMRTLAYYQQQGIGPHPQATPEQKALFALQLHQQHQFHEQKRAAVAGKSAKQAIDFHQAFGDDALKGALNDTLHNGGDPNFIQQVAQQLYHNGRPDLAQIHSEAADGW